MVGLQAQARASLSYAIAKTGPRAFRSAGAALMTQWSGARRGGAIEDATRFERLPERPHLVFCPHAATMLETLRKGGGDVYSC